jgi:endonuclease/exonuclease/phosphatase (EEP) superfamily protein YafD
MITRLFLVLTLLFSLPLVAGFFGAFHPAFDSFAHFRVHLAVLMGLAALPLVFSSWWAHGLVGVLLAAAAVASAVGIPGVGRVHAAFEDRAANVPNYRLLQLNLRYNNPQPERFAALLAEQRPDFVTLNEVSSMWADRLRELLNSYPYQLRCGRGSRVGGTAILSRIPFSPSRMTQCSGSGSLATAAVELEGRTVVLAALHLGWPWPSAQAWQVGKLTPEFAQLGPDAILAGDLNATPWSQTPKRVAAAGSLTPMRSVGPTWLFRWLPPGLRPWIGLPIDHVFTKGGIVLHSGKALDEVSSDHLPVLIEFSVTGAAKPAQTVTALASAD